MGLLHRHGLNWLFIAVLFFVPLLSLYLLEQFVRPSENAFQSVSSDFQYSNGDGQWLDFNPNVHGDEKVTGSYEFRTVLPENRWRDPYLYLKFVPNAEVYLDDQQMYTFKPRYEYWEHPHLLELPNDFSGQLLTIRVDFHHQYMYPSMITIDSPLNLVLKLALRSDYRIALGFIALLTSIAGFVLYAGRRQRNVLYFSLFALYIAQLCISRSWSLFGLLIPVPGFAYFQDVILAFGGYCFLRFYEELFGGGKYNIHRRLSQGMLVVFPAMLVTSLLFPSFYFYNMSVVLQNWIAPMMMAIILISSIHTYRQQRNAETFWFMAGFVFVGLSTLVYFLQPAIQSIVNQIAPGRFRLSVVAQIFYNGDRFLHGIFILLFCMAMIMSERIRGVYMRAKQTAEELTRLSGSLEQLVQKRTKALTQTNLNLRSSMQETAEALAEVAVLEDRNRIAQDMHDYAGHSLTAALIQIEAAKMLATKDANLTLGKLGAIRESVATGLESIRETVRMMKLDYEERALIPSMQKLIQEIQNSTGIRVIYDPTPLPDLNTMVKKTLYLALQEGITNGIRHGKASRFEFSLDVVEDSIHFRLANSGENYAGQHFGFGLNTMRERIERLHGTIHLETNSVHACMLSIDLPIQSDGEESEGVDR